LMLFLCGFLGFMGPLILFCSNLQIVPVYVPFHCRPTAIAAPISITHLLKSPYPSTPPHPHIAAMEHVDEQSLQALKEAWADPHMRDQLASMIGDPTKAKQLDKMLGGQSKSAQGSPESATAPAPKQQPKGKPSASKQSTPPPAKQAAPSRSTDLTSQ